VGNSTIVNVANILLQILIKKYNLEEKYKISIFDHKLPNPDVRRPIKGSKDGYFHLVYFKRKKRLPLRIFSQVPITPHRRHAVTSHCPTKFSKTKLPSFFTIEAGRLSASFN